MAKPLVAIVGRPNVGKSTLVNRIAESNEAIVHEMRGVTRDRSYHDADWNGREFTLIDTGGIEVDDSDRFQASIRAQAIVAAEQADVVIFVVDGLAGVNTDDEAVARILYRSEKPVLLAVNKLDNVRQENAMWEFMSLGLGEPHPISALHGTGTGDLLDEVVALFPEPAEVAEELEDETVKVAIIGRPNAGKSSLTNKLTDNDRSIVSDVAGTTRDAIDTVVEHDGRLYTIIDTAGLRKKSAIDADVEYYGSVRAMRAMDRADVVLLVIDSEIGLTDQDQRVAGMALERGCAMAIILNKWDLVEGPEAKAKLRERIEDRMTFVGFAPVIAISALSGKNVHRIWDAIDSVYAAFSRKVSTSKLNEWLQDVREFGHTVSKGKYSLKLKYATQTGEKPPFFTFFCTHPELADDQFKRYLENRLRKSFDFEGTPIRMKFKNKG